MSPAGPHRSRLLLQVSRLCQVGWSGAWRRVPRAAGRGRRPRRPRRPRPGSAGRTRPRRGL